MYTKHDLTQHRERVTGAGRGPGARRQPCCERGRLGQASSGCQGHLPTGLFSLWQPEGRDKGFSVVLSSHKQRHSIIARGSVGEGESKAWSGGAVTVPWRPSGEPTWGA